MTILDREAVARLTHKNLDANFVRSEGVVAYTTDLGDLLSRAYPGNLLDEIRAKTGKENAAISDKGTLTPLLTSLSDEIPGTLRVRSDMHIRRRRKDPEAQTVRAIQLIAGEEVIVEGLRRKRSPVTKLTERLQAGGRRFRRY